MQIIQLRQSKALAEVGYDADARTLRLRFRNGGLYDYFDVPPDAHAGLIASPHPWTEYREHITSSYDYERLE